MAMKRLYRSRDDVLIAGVLAGIGEYFEVDPTIVRIIGVLVALVTGIVPFVIVYIIAVIIIPKRSEHEPTEVVRDADAAD